MYLGKCTPLELHENVLANAVCVVTTSLHGKLNWPDSRLTVAGVSHMLGPNSTGWCHDHLTNRGGAPGTTKLVCLIWRDVDPVTGCHAVSMRDERCTNTVVVNMYLPRG